MRYTNRLILLLCISAVFRVYVDSGANNTTKVVCPQCLLKPGVKDKLRTKSTLVSLNASDVPKIKKSKQEVVYDDKPDVVNKDQIHNQRRYYKPNYVKGSTRYSDPYWRKPFKSVSFGFDI